jgi:pilus assembly protein TadC
MIKIFGFFIILYLGTGFVSSLIVFFLGYGTISESASLILGWPILLFRLFGGSIGTTIELSEDIASGDREIFNKFRRKGETDG